MNIENWEGTVPDSPVKLLFKFNLPEKGNVSFYCGIGDNYNSIGQEIKGQENRSIQFDPSNIQLSSEDYQLILTKLKESIVNSILPIKIGDNYTEESGLVSTRILIGSTALLRDIARMKLGEQECNDFIIRYFDDIHKKIDELYSKTVDEITLNTLRSLVNNEFASYIADGIKNAFKADPTNFILKQSEILNVVSLEKLIDPLLTDGNCIDSFVKLFEQDKNFLNKMSIDQLTKITSVLCKQFVNKKLNEVFASLGDTINEKYSKGDEAKNFTEKLANYYMEFYLRNQFDQINLSSISTGLMTMFNNSKISEELKTEILINTINNIPNFPYPAGSVTTSKLFLIKNFIEQCGLFNIKLKEGCFDINELIPNNKENETIFKTIKNKIKNDKKGELKQAIVKDLCNFFTMTDDTKFIKSFVQFYDNLGFDKVEMIKLSLEHIAQSNEFYDFVKIPLMNCFLNQAGYKDKDIIEKKKKTIDDKSKELQNEILNKQEDKNINIGSNINSIFSFFEEKKKRIEKMTGKEKDNMEMIFNTNKFIITKKFGIKLDEFETHEKQTEQELLQEINSQKEQNNNNIEQQTQIQQEQIQPKAEPEQKTHVQKLEEKKRAQITSQINIDSSESDDEKRYEELRARYTDRKLNNPLNPKEMLEMSRLAKKLNASQNQLPGK